MKRLLLLSNGAGEDAIAAKILERLPGEIRRAVLCCPLVGSGHALRNFELCGPRVLPPSEGLFRESWALAFKDLARGVIAGHLRQLRFLRELRSEVALTVAVGDLFPVLWAKLGSSGRILFVGTAKSVYHHPYSPLERLLLRAWVEQSLVRDQVTAETLRRYEVAADWLGNAMMDEVQPQGVKLPFEDGPVVTLFPGSRGQAPGVLAYQLEVLDLLRPDYPRLQVGVALAPGCELSDLVAPSLEKGWSLRSGPGGGAHLGVLTRGQSEVHLLSGVLGDLLSVSTVALGQAGTANEQAAGAGVPVVAYDPKGERGLKWYRKRQKGLLGDAVSVVAMVPDIIAQELNLLLGNGQERERRARIGRERMGPPGGCERMAAAIARMWQGE